MVNVNTNKQRKRVIEEMDYGVNQKTNMFLLKQIYTFHMFLNVWLNNDYLDAKKAIVRCRFT